MRFRSLIVLSFGLSFCGCDKPKASENTHAESASATQSTRRSLAARESAAASQNFEERLTRADTLDPVEREKELAAIAWDAMEREPSLAHQSFAKMAQGSDGKIRLIQHYALRLAEQDVEQAIEWALALEGEAEISAALCHIAVVIAENNPQRAANLLSESGVSKYTAEVAAVQVIQRWAAKSPPEAAAWVSQFPPGDSRRAGVAVIAERWLPRDASAAFAWMDGIKDHNLRQETARAMEGVILQQSEETRAAWRQHATESLLAELELQRENALKDMGNNVPSSE